MASGNRRLRINTQERAVSSDINRLQQFQNQDFGEFLRLLLNVGTLENDPGTVTESTTLGTPLGAEVINGLLVRPVAGNFALTVDPGILTALAPDAAADDSNYKYIRDPGIPSAGTLAITANSSGSIRIDVVECRVNPVEATVSDSRDIFDPSTGFFSATSVTKELKGQLEYRVRAGTGGSGYPTAQSGWLPLCVASVPDSVASNDGITFWDVRPMIADRANGAMNNALPDELLDCDDVVLVPDNTHANMTGTAHAILNGRRVGGHFKSGVPGAVDAAPLNAYDPINQDTGTITFGVLTGNAHVYIATPFGLPRWSRYTTGPSGRVPGGGPKGIPIVSATVPTEIGNPATAIALPASTGLLGTTAEAICLDVITWGGNTGTLQAHRTQNKCSYTDSPMNITGGAYNVLNTDRTDFHVRNEDWPPNAKYAFINIQQQITIAGGASANMGDEEILIWNTDDLSGELLEFVSANGGLTFNHTGAPVDIFTMSGTVAIPRPLPRPDGTPPTSPRLIQFTSAAGETFTNIAFSIYGFQF